MESWAFVARCQITLGEFAAARAAYDRAISFAARFSNPSFQLFNLLPLGTIFCLRLITAGTRSSSVPGEVELLKNPPAEFRWAYAALLGHRPSAGATKSVEQTCKCSLRYARLCLRGAPWGLTYSMIACDAAAALWLIEPHRQYRSVREQLASEGARPRLSIPDARRPSVGRSIMRSFGPLR